MKKRPNRPIAQDDRRQATSPQLVDALALDTPERILAYCREMGFINGTITDVQRLIEGTPNLSLSFEDIGENDAYIRRLDDGSFSIVVNKKHPRTRQRFSMAHEYIHFQMHRPEIDGMALGEKILHRNDERNRIEYQANSGAGEILMPENVFRRVAIENKGSIAALAEAFDVSTLAVRFRARELGIPGHGL